MASLLARALQRKAAASPENKYSLRDLEKASGVNYSFISRIVSGHRRPSALTVRALSRALSPYLPLDEALLAAGHAPDNPKISLAADAIPLPFAVPVYEDLPVHAGDGGVPIQVIYLEPAPTRNEGAVIGLLVKGDCMSPAIEEGEIVIVDREGEPEDGDAVVVELEDGWALRRYSARNGAARLSCDNPRSGETPIPLTADTRIYPVIDVRKGRPRRRQRS